MPLLIKCFSPFVAPRHPHLRAPSQLASACQPVSLVWPVSRVAPPEEMVAVRA